MTRIDPSIQIPYTDYRYLDYTDVQKKTNLYLPDYIFETLNKAEYMLKISSLLFLEDNLSSTRKEFDQAFYFISQNFAAKYRHVADSEAGQFGAVYLSEQTRLVIALLVCFVVTCAMIVSTMIILMVIYSSIYNRMIDALELFRLLDLGVVETYIGQCDEFHRRFINELKFENVTQKQKDGDGLQLEDPDEFDEIMKAKEEQEQHILAIKRQKERNEARKPSSRPLEKDPNTPGRLFSDPSRREVKLQTPRNQNPTSERDIIISGNKTLKKTPTLSKDFSSRMSRHYQQMQGGKQEEEEEAKEKMVYRRAYLKEVFKRTVFAAVIWFPLTIYVLYRDYANYQEHDVALSHLKSTLEVKVSANYLTAFTYYLATSGQPILVDMGSLSSSDDLQNYLCDQEQVSLLDKVRKMNSVVQSQSKSTQDLNSALSDYNTIRERAMQNTLCFPEINPTDAELSSTSH